MKFNFDEINDRSNTLAVKWDECAPGELPMWIADMDFKTAPCITEALAKRVDNGIFGYSYIPEAWYEAVIGWWKRRHHYEIPRESLVFATGVIPTISSCVRRLTHGNDNVVMLTPIYNTFYNCIVNQGARFLDCPLLEKEGHYSIDWEDLESKLALPLTTLMIVCNPQNPTGNIWTKEELSRIGELCKKHGVTVISDEIHCDITDPGYGYIPFASVSEVNADISITCLSIGKTFNAAGLNSAACVITNPHLREVVVRGLNNDECAEPNVFAMQATIAAYTQGDEWLDQLLAYLAENRRYAKEYFEKEMPSVHLVDSHATYLLWVDVSAVAKDTKAFCEHLRQEAKLFVVPGETYHQGGYIRINIACPKSMVKEGLARLKKGIISYKGE